MPLKKIICNLAKGDNLYSMQFNWGELQRYLADCVHMNHSRLFPMSHCSHYQCNAIELLEVYDMIAYDECDQWYYLHVNF